MEHHLLARVLLGILGILMLAMFFHGCGAKPLPPFTAVTEKNSRPPTAQESQWFASQMSGRFSKAKGLIHEIRPAESSGYEIRLTTTSIHSNPDGLPVPIKENQMRISVLSEDF
jgi:hypothetical protein